MKKIINPWDHLQLIKDHSLAFLNIFMIFVGLNFGVLLGIFGWIIFTCSQVDSKCFP